MPLPTSKAKQYSLSQLLTEATTILFTIREKAKSDQSIPQDPLGLISGVLGQSRNSAELQQNLNEALSLKQGNFKIDALIDYVSILAKVQSETISLSNLDEDYRKYSNRE